MNKVDDLFKKKTSEVTFIELKEGSCIDINGYKLTAGLPLPVITDKLIEDIQYNDLSEEISLGQAIDGMIFLLGADSNFPHMDQYKEIMYSYNPKIEDYVFYLGMKHFEDGDFENSGVYFRANKELDSNNIKAKLNYGLVLESMGKNLIELEKVEEGEEFLHKSTNEFESILDIEESYSLAYYKLGYHYRYFEQYLKAKITWDKFLTLDKDEMRLQEIREQIDLIDNESKMEAGLSYLAYNDFGKALDLFLKLLSNHKDNWNVNYLIGLAYKGLEDFDTAIEYLNRAIELNKLEADIYNELGIVYFIQGKILEAISIFNEGIAETEEDYKLFFNRGLGYIQLGEFELALTDITKADELNPNDKNIIKQKQEVENYLKSI